MNDLEKMIAMISQKNTFRKFTDSAETWHACERHHMPNIHTILEIHGSEGVSIGYSTWYFDREGHYLACGFDS